MANEQWRARVQRAQEMAAERLGVDVTIMQSPRQPDGGGAAAAHQAEAEPVAVAEVAQPEPVAAVEAAVETAPATGTATPATAESSEAPSAAQRIAEAKARAAAKGSNGGPTAATAAAATETPAAPKPKPAAKPVPATEAAPAEEEVGQQGINRREFLTYAWGAALGLLTLEIGVGSYYFLYPRFRAGEFGGAFNVPLGELPPSDAAPNGNATGKFWLVDTEDGPRALYMVCTHLGCLYKWEPANFRFECPCHASKFSHDGHYIEGPASRSLDQFVIEIVQNGEVISSTEDTGDNIAAPQIPGPDAQIVVQTGRRILGKPADQSPARVAG